jgi:hypothetical protein
MRFRGCLERQRARSAAPRRLGLRSAKCRIYECLFKYLCGHMLLKRQLLELAYLRLRWACRRRCACRHACSSSGGKSTVAHAAASVFAAAAVFALFVLVKQIKGVPDASVFVLLY